MIYNILSINDINYLKISLSHINSYHKLDKDQKFKLYIDEEGEDFFKKNKDKLRYPSNVDYKIFDPDKYWQKNKIKIYEEYHLKGDFVIIDADSLWYSKPKLYEDKITFLNVSHTLNNSPNTPNDYKKIKTLNKNIQETMTNNQIGFLHIPLKIQYSDLLNEWYNLCDQIYDLQDVRKDINRQCEQLAISLISQLNKIPLNFLKPPVNPPNDKKIIQSLYWSCRNKGINNDLKISGWK